MENKEWIELVEYEGENGNIVLFNVEGGITIVPIRDFIQRGYEAIFYDLNCGVKTACDKIRQGDVEGGVYQHNIALVIRALFKERVDAPAEQVREPDVKKAA